MKSGVVVKRNFTMVELLTVLIIVAIMMAVLLPVFSGSIRGKQENQAANIVTANLMQARSYAASNNCYVALVFALKKGATANDVSFTVVRPAIVDFNGSSFSFVEWLQGSRWDSFPPGVILVPDTANFGFGSGDKAITGVSSSSSVSGIPPADLTDNGFSTLHNQYLVFRPTGQLYQSSGFNPFVIRIMQGFYNGNTFTGTQKDASDNVVSTVIRINALTGRGRVLGALEVGVQD